MRYINRGSVRNRVVLDAQMHVNLALCMLNYFLCMQIFVFQTLLNGQISVVHITFIFLFEL